MERSIDRTSYRRSARQSVKVMEKLPEPEIQKTSKKFRLTNLLLNQVIVSLLIIIGVLTAQYFEITSVTNWIAKNMSNGYEMQEIVSKIKKKFFSENPETLLILQNSGENISGDFSGENFLSGEQVVSEEDSGESSGELISAVEGINQMAEDAQMIKEQYQLQLPLKGIITSTFGSRESDSSIVSSYHTGIDIAANTGTEIQSAHHGKVTMAKAFSSYGNCVMIEEGNLLTVYAHCSSLNVVEEQEVKKGDTIAKVGMTGNATGPHLHFEIRYEGRYVDPQSVLEF